MTKSLTAFIKSLFNGELTTMWHDDYSAKIDFRRDLKANGYVVYAILTDDEIEAIKNRRELTTREEIDLGVKYTKMHKDLVDYVDQCL